MDITSEMVKELRQRTGIGMMECKKALEEACGDAEKAIGVLRKKGYARAKDKEARATAAGIVGSYIHLNGKIGVLVEVNCESDFVARNEEFQELVKNICLQIAAASPKYVAPEDIPAEIVEKIVLGKLGKFYEEVCLLDQVYIKDDKVTIRQLILSAVAKIGENIKIGRFTRYEIGKS